MLVYQKLPTTIDFQSEINDFVNACVQRHSGDLLLRYCSVCPILLEQVEIWQDGSGHSSSAEMAGKTNLNQQKMILELVINPI